MGHTEAAAFVSSPLAYFLFHAFRLLAASLPMQSS